jgi:hypothetical protein
MPENVPAYILLVVPYGWNYGLVLDYLLFRFWLNEEL